MTIVAPKHKDVKLNHRGILAEAMKVFDPADYNYIRQLHDKNPKRSATGKERKFICDLKAKDDKLTQEDLVKWAKFYLNLIVSQPTVSRWLENPSNQDPLSDTAAKVKRRSSVECPDLEKKRFGGNWDLDMALVEEIRSILDQYSWCDIYNMDETSHFYQQEDTRSPANTRHEGRQLSEKRVTLALCCNGDGTDKLHPFIIGRSKKPHCFRNVNMSRVKCTYRNNTKAWMTTFLFAEWLKAFDLRMKLLGKKEVLLILDNISVHKSTKLMELPQLERTRILYLPENTTSKLQPLDAGVIKNFKLYYRKRFNRCILRRLEDLDNIRIRSAIERRMGINRDTPLAEDPKHIPNISVLEAIHMTIAAWDDVTQETIQGCFRHCGIKAPEEEQSIQDRQDRKDGQDGVDLDQQAVNDVEKTFELLRRRQPEYFRGDLDIRELLNREEDHIDTEEYADTHLTMAELLAADDSDDDKEDSSDEETEEKKEEVRIISREEAQVHLKMILSYILQQEERDGDMSQEMEVIKRLQDFTEKKRVLTLQQTNIKQFFKPIY